MKLKFNGFLVLLVVLMAQITLRKKELFGVVSDNAGLPLPGVSVLKELLEHKLILMEPFLSKAVQLKC
jgi:hypothetical protein